jgi:5-oxoprolinase (ATP-hydrolysing)
VLKEKAIEAVLELGLLSNLKVVFTELAAEGKKELNLQDPGNTEIQLYEKLHLRYEGTDAALVVNFADLAAMQNQFAELHRQRYGFIAEEKPLIVEAVTVELVLHHDAPFASVISRINDNLPIADTTVQMFTAGKWWDTPVYRRENLQPGDCILGPAIIVEHPKIKSEKTRSNFLYIFSVLYFI